MSDSKVSIFAGNLNYKVTVDDITSLFEEFGEVKNVKLISKKGMAFIDMTHKSDAEEAVESLMDTSFMNRKLFIDWARPQQRKEKPEGTGRPAVYK